MPLDLEHLVTLKSDLIGNNGHMAPTTIRLCSGENVFSLLPQIVLTVSIESVLQENPVTAIVSAGQTV